MPGAFFAFDGLVETFLTVMGEFGAYPAVIERELRRYLPFLATTAYLLAMVRKCMGREEAHELLKEHAVAAALELREGGADNTLAQRLVTDDRVPLDVQDISQIHWSPMPFTGAAVRQVNEVVERVRAILPRYPEAASYTPGGIL